MHLRRLTALLAAAATLLAPSLGNPLANAETAERVTTSSWTPLTASPSPNFARASVARTADGTQHVVWLVDNADRTHNYEHTTISPTGVQGPVHRVLASNWAQLGTPVDLGVNPDGSLRLAFRGSIDGGTADFFSYRGVYSAISADGGATWVVPREVLAPSTTSGGVTLAYLPDGTTIAGYGDTGGFHWHVGAVPEASVPGSVVQEFTDHDAVGASLVTSGGSVLVVYESYRGGGIFARQVWPTLGAPVRAPGASTGTGHPVAVVDRPGVGGVAAYTVGSKVVLWDIRAGRTHAVRGMDGPNNVALTALSDGHLWVVAQGPIGYTTRASRVAASGWRTDRTPARLDPMYSTFNVEVGSAGALRAELVLTANESGAPTRMHAQSVEAQMSLKASPRRWRVGRVQRVAFKVKDVDGAVRGVKVRAAGKRCTTNAAGRCKIQFRAYPRPRKIKAKATRASYIDDVVKLKVRR